MAITGGNEPTNFFEELNKEQMLELTKRDIKQDPEMLNRIVASQETGLATGQPIDPETQLLIDSLKADQAARSDFDAAFDPSQDYTDQLFALKQEIDDPSQLPSAAEIMMKNEGEAAARGAASTMATQRGGSAGMKAMEAARMGSAARGVASGQTGVIRAQEAEGTRAFRNNQRMQLLDAIEANRAAAMNREGIRAGIQSNQESARLRQQQLDDAKDSRTWDRIAGGVGMAATAAGTYFGGPVGGLAAKEGSGYVLDKLKPETLSYDNEYASSDINMKKNIQDGSQESQSFLDALEPYAYNYKDPQGANGERLGVMAQDIEKTPMNYMVKDTPDGKMVDYGQGFGAILAAVADMHGRVKNLEGKKGKK